MSKIPQHIIKSKNHLQGLIKRHPDGFGFFIPDDKNHPDVYVPKHSMVGVMTNDRVMIEVFPERGGERFRGEIIKIIARSVKKVVGQYFSLNEKWGMIKDESKSWGMDLKIPIEESLNADPGHLVVAEITQYPEDGEKFIGRICEVIGDAEDPLHDIKRVLVGHHIPHEFSSGTLNEASQFTEHVPDKDILGRKDIRHLNLITIDGATAKDFDDAVCVEQNEKGFLLYVAIADVSHYVKIGSHIDKDAFERGTSVYFPNFVVPMLPEVLSNGLCSLNPHLPRLCLVAEMQFDYTGNMLSSSFYEAVMESKARVTYGEAQEIIDGNDISKFSHVKENILKCYDLSKILMAKRFKDGSLDLEIPETQIVLDAAGIPVDIIKSERLYAHRLIEELMLAANVAVALFLSNKEIPAIYRIHEPPFEDAINILERYLHNFGGKKLGSGKLQKRLTRALQEFKGKPEATILNILTLRSMTQAKYSSNNLGHFGLGFEHYTHFTSPIRRYPDLIVHRLVKSQIMRGYAQMSEDEISTSATMLSACEQRSVKAERQFHSIKKARFMHKLIGQEYDGIISSVTKFGVFVLLRAFDVDGLVRLESLGSEPFIFDEDTLELVGKRSGMKFCIGDLVKIRVANADVEIGQIDFELMSVAEEHPYHDRFQKSKKEKTHNRRDRDFERSKGSRHSKSASKHSQKNPKIDQNDKKKSRAPQKKTESRKLKYLSEKETREQTTSEKSEKNRFYKRPNNKQQDEKQYGEKRHDKKRDKEKQHPEKRYNEEKEYIKKPGFKQNFTKIDDQSGLDPKHLERLKQFDSKFLGDKKGDNSSNRQTNRPNNKKRR